MSANKDVKTRVLTGNEACALGALESGCDFFGGYPITPSSEIAEDLSVLLPRRGGVFIQMEDEIAAMGAVIGASLAGSKAMTATSGPGFSLKQENIGFACMAEVPCVIVNVMRGGPSTGLPTMPAQGDVMQARWGTHGDHPIIVLVPNSVGESYELTIRAFNLTEKYRIPVILLLDEIIGHTNEKVKLAPAAEIVNRKGPDVPPDRYLPYRHTEDCVPPMATYARSGYRFHVTGLAHDETGFPTNNPKEIEKLNMRLNAKMEIHRDDIVEVVETDCRDVDTAIFAYGSVARAANQAIHMAAEEGIRVGLFRPRTLWPFPDREVLEMARKVDTILVPEMNLGMIAHEVEWASRCEARIVQFHRVDGQPIRPPQILELIKEAAQKASAGKA